ncbi:unnamed protein product [Phytomonas sp. Hart1]|nr:unnamed protein product [Phytomonas sp. Hart1]|eukprot:CCW66042.1 unnamed protein product [Phytomonas sp. isolate Hart1]
MWLPTEKTNMCGSKQCYSSQKSFTATLNWGLYFEKYIHGPVTGVFVKDTVRLGSFTTEQIFAEVNDVSGLGEMYVEAEWDGVIGMGWPSVFGFAIRPTIFSLFNSYENIPNQFAFYLPKNPDIKGELVLGGYDPNHFYDDLITERVTSTTRWTVVIFSVNIGYTVLNCMVTAVIDSGSTFFNVPKAAFEKIVHETGTKMNQGGYIIDCMRVPFLPNIELEIGGSIWIFTGEDYTINMGNKICILAISPLESDLVDKTTWILGEIFLKHIYTVFDADKSTVSFAYAK